MGSIVGYKPQALVRSSSSRSLDDWKTAWDHIHFDGFLGTRMTLQFIWQGCDSLLAAPLLLDIVRLTQLARRRGETGLLTFLASFFKSPYGVAEQRSTGSTKCWKPGPRRANRPDEHPLSSWCETLSLTIEALIAVTIETLLTGT